MATHQAPLVAATVSHTAARLAARLVATAPASVATEWVVDTVVMVDTGSNL